MSTSMPHAVRLPVLASMRAWRPQLSTEQLVVLACAWFALAGNGSFWHSAMASHPGSLRYALSLLLVLMGAHGVLLGVLVWRWNAKAVVGLLLLVTALASHYMSRYHIYLDADMLRNVLATDRKESGELLTASLVWPLLTLAALPMLLLWRVRVRRRPPREQGRGPQGVGRGREIVPGRPCRPRGLGPASIAHRTGGSHG